MEHKEVVASKKLGITAENGCGVAEAWSFCKIKKHHRLQHEIFKTNSRSKGTKDLFLWSDLLFILCSGLYS